MAISANITDARTEEVVKSVLLDCLPRPKDILWVTVGNDRINLVVMQVCHWVSDSSHSVCIYTKELPR